MREVTRLHDRRGSARPITSLFSTYVMWVSLSFLTCSISLMTLGYAQASPDDAPRSDSEDKTEDKTSTHTADQAQAETQAEHDIQARTDTQTKTLIQPKIGTPPTVQRHTPKRGSTKSSPKRETQAQVDQPNDVQVDTPNDTPTGTQNVVTPRSPINTQTETKNNESDLPF